jgi:Glyoxalase-like domain
MDEAARRYAALGFQLTPRSHHSLGSFNHLCVFAHDYLELLGPGDGRRPELAGMPIGLNGLVFALRGDAEALHDGLRGRGLPVQAVQRFSRPVVIEGEPREARFATVRLAPRLGFDGRVYFCQHLTPELVWRAEWQAHRNGALALAKVALAARDPDSVAAVFDRMFDGAVARAAGRPHVLRAGTVAVEIWPRDELAQALGAATPDPAGRADHMALVGIRVRSLRGTEDTLRSNGVRHTVEAGRILVPASEAMNVAVEFLA